MNPDLRIVPAPAGVAPAAARLLLMTMGELGPYLFGLGSRRRARALLARLFAEGRNRFGHPFADVVRVEEEVVGLILALPHETLEALALPTARGLWRGLGWVGFVRFLGRSLPLIGLREGEPGAYFVGNLAVEPAWRGRGIGRILLAHVEARAARLGFGRIALTVEVENEGAIAFYRRQGYRVLERIPFRRWLAERVGSVGVLRMGKSLP